MVLRFAIVLSVVAAATPSFAETLAADAARRFVANRQFSFTCFEGSVGSGRIGADGSVAGVIRIRGEAPTRFIHLPAGTLFAKGETVCSYVKGALFNPCFNLEKTGANTFRGAVSGFGFAYCDFVRRNGSQELLAAVSPFDQKLPMPTIRSIRRGAKVKREPEDTTASTAKPGAPAPVPAPSAAPPSAPVAAPTTPVTAAPLPSMGEAGMRGSQ
jgi:hypothetical protein